MPWKVEKGHGCPPSRPWACVNESNGHVHGCHATKADGLKQAAALYANTNESKSLPDGGTAVDSPVRETNEQNTSPSTNELVGRELVESVLGNLTGRQRAADDLGDAEFLYGLTSQLREAREAVTGHDSDNPEVKALLASVAASNAEHVAAVRKLAWQLSGGKALPLPAQPEPAAVDRDDKRSDGLPSGDAEPSEVRTEARATSTLTEPRASSGTKAPYGNVSYADPGYQKDKKKRYPIDTKEHVKAAWSYINQSDNASAYTPEQLARIKARIKSAAKRLGVQIGSDSKSRLLSGFQVRSFDFQNEVSSDGRTLEGYAAVFNSVSRIADWGGDFDEVIRPGAFTRSLAERTPVLQFEHGRDARVGAVPIGAIEDIHEDSKGLYVRARLYDNPVVEPVRQAIEGRSINGMSFRFAVPKDGHKWTLADERTDGVDDADFREILHTDTREIGPVVFPAYDDTTVGVRALMAQLDPDERSAMYRELVRDLADELELRGLPILGQEGFTPEAAIDAVSTTDFPGRSDARSADGGDSETESSSDRGSSFVDEFSERIDRLRFRESQDAPRLRL
jgi:HK97 family phage prohead protease